MDSCEECHRLIRNTIVLALSVTGFSFGMKWRVSMRSFESSRRQLLGSLVAGILGVGWSSSRAAAGLPRKQVVVDDDVLETTYTYDDFGALIAIDGPYFEYSAGA